MIRYNIIKEGKKKLLNSKLKIMWTWVSEYVTYNYIRMILCLE